MPPEEKLLLQNFYLFRAMDLSNSCKTGGLVDRSILSLVFTKLNFSLYSVLVQLLLDPLALGRDLATPIACWRGAPRWLAGHIDHAAVT